MVARQCSGDGVARIPPGAPLGGTGTSRARAAPRRAPRSAGERLGDVRLGVAPLEVGEEHVAAEPLLARPRLDPGQVDVAVGELRQAADEPAGRLGADAPEDDRGLPRPRRRSASPCVRARPDRRQPHEPGLVRRPRPRRPRAARRSRTARRRGGCRAPPTARRARRPVWTALGGRAAGEHARLGQPVADEAGALGVRLRVRDDGLDLAELERVRAIRQCRIGWTTSPTIATSSVSIASASSVALTEPSSEFSIGTSARSTSPSWTAITVVVDRRERDELGALAAARAERVDQRLLGERALGSEVADPHRRDAAPATPTAAGRRRPRARAGSPRSPPARARARRCPSWTCLAYSRAWSRWWIDESTMPERVASSSAIDVDWRPDISP